MIMDHKRLYIERKKSIATIVRDVLREEDEYEEDDDFRRRMSILEHRFSLDESSSTNPEQSVEQGDDNQIVETPERKGLSKEGNSCEDNTVGENIVSTSFSSTNEPKSDGSKLGSSNSDSSLQESFQQRNLQVIIL